MSMFELYEDSADEEIAIQLPARVYWALLQFFLLDYTGPQSDVLELGFNSIMLELIDNGFVREVDSGIEDA